MSVLAEQIALLKEKDSERTALEEEIDNLEDAMTIDVSEEEALEDQKMLASKKLALASINKQTKEIGEIIKELQASTKKVAPPSKGKASKEQKSASTRKKQSTGGPKSESKSKVVPVKKNPWTSYLYQAVATAAFSLFNHKEILLFGAAVPLIYYYGDYASV